MNIENGKIYRHFKGGLYQVLCKARHTENDEELIIYQALYGKYEIFARPLSMFCSIVDKKKYPECTQKYRFEEVDRDSLNNSGRAVKEELLENQMSVKETSYFDMENEKGDSDISFIMQFLETESIEEKLDLLRRNRDRIDERTITNIEASMDVVSGNTDLDTRIGYICDILRTRSQYENRRLRG